MPQNTFYKKQTTPKEREACFRWFEQHIDQLPRELEIPSMRITDLPFCVRRMIQSQRVHLAGSPLYEGNFALLRYIQDILMKTGNFDSQPPKNNSQTEE